LLGAPVRVLTTFSGSTYDTITEPCIANALKYGADEVWIYDDLWLTKHPFYSQQSNRWLYEHHYKRGLGWYTFKMVLLLDAWQRLLRDDPWLDKEPSQLIAYCDGDTYPIADFSILYDVAERDGAMLFVASGQMQRQWCKRDAYIIMAQDEAKYHASQAGNARYMSFKVGDWKAYQFIIEWLTYSCNQTATTFDASILGPELEGFTESRSEQAIMTLLAHKYGYKLHRECCEGGEGWPEDRDMYGQIFSQVHQRNGAPPTGSKFAGRWDKTGRLGDL
jgi:hypothetical protein